MERIISKGGEANPKVVEFVPLQFTPLFLFEWKEPLIILKKKRNCLRSLSASFCFCFIRTMNFTDKCVLNFSLFILLYYIVAACIHLIEQSMCCSLKWRKLKSMCVPYFLFSFCWQENIFHPIGTRKLLYYKL